MESQRKKEGILIESLAGPPQFPAPVSIVRVACAPLAGLVAGAGVRTDFYLGRDERARFAAFRYEKRRLEWLAGRIAAKCAALQLATHSTATNWPAEQWQRMQIAADDSGKPYLLPRPDLAAPPAISISHSRGLAVAMAGPRLCGIDIQQITPAIARVAERFVAAGDEEILAPAVAAWGRPAALTLLWSAKEAVKKAAAGPLVPGFLHISLTALQRAAEGFVFAVTAAEQAAGGGSVRQQHVWLRLLDDFSLAMTMTEKGEP
jgi:phosphopantetheinyl transferase